MAHSTTLSKTITHQSVFRSSIFRSLIWLSLLLALCILSTQVMASEGVGGSLPYESWLTSLRNSVTGPVAFTLSVVGIVIAGGALIFGGDLNGFFRSLVFLTLVMALVIGANNIMSGFFGRGATLAFNADLPTAATCI